MSKKDIMTINVIITSMVVLTLLFLPFFFPMSLPICYGILITIMYKDRKQVNNQFKKLEDKAKECGGYVVREGRQWPNSKIVYTDTITWRKHRGYGQGHYVTRTYHVVV